MREPAPAGLEAGRCDATFSGGAFSGSAGGGAICTGSQPDATSARTFRATGGSIELDGPLTRSSSSFKAANTNFDST